MMKKERKRLLVFGALSLFSACQLCMTSFAGNWVKNGTVWEYHENGVKVVNRWVQDNGKWYYFGKSGAMAHNQCVDGYYISSDGVWRKNETEKAVKKSGRIIQSDWEVVRDFGYATDNYDSGDTELDVDWE